MHCFPISKIERRRMKSAACRERIEAAQEYNFIPGPFLLFMYSLFCAFPLPDERQTGLGLLFRFFFR